MRIPGFSAHHAIGPAQTRGGTALPTRATGVSPALGIGWGSVNSGLFWACFRNCYDRCGESEPGALLRSLLLDLQLESDRRLCTLIIGFRRPVCPKPLRPWLMAK